MYHTHALAQQHPTVRTEVDEGIRPLHLRRLLPIQPLEFISQFFQVLECHPFGVGFFHEREIAYRCIDNVVKGELASLQSHPFGGIATDSQPFEQLLHREKGTNLP